MSLPTTSELFLGDYEDIIDAVKSFEAEPQLAETTQIIIIEEYNEEIDDTNRENKFRAITTILTECSKHRVLEAFKWQTGITPLRSVHDTSTRPAEFWEALAKVAPNLQHLSLDFYTHELDRMDERGISVKFPSTFPVLKSLYIDCTGSHGDDGSPIEKLLHGSPNLTFLDISAPLCNLESCRIQGLTWTYKFPQLAHFVISIFYQSAQDMGFFLANHPNIRTLVFSAEGEEQIPNVTSLLPNLEALSMNNNWGQATSPGYTEVLNANPPQKIIYLKTFYQYSLIPQYAPSLRCLELSLDTEHLRNEGANGYASTKQLLALFQNLPDLSELAIQFYSGMTTIIKDGTSRNPLPMNEEILSKIIKALPESGNLQVLRMKDVSHNGNAPLGVQSSTFASLQENIPSSLKILQWEMDNSIIRYEFEPGQPIRIVDYSPPKERQWPDTQLWTDASILKHLRS